MIIGQYIGIGYSSPLEALPDYSSLSNIQLYVDYTDLAVGTTNDSGVVDGSGNVTTLKSLTPGPTGRNFTSNGTAPTLTADGIVFGGAGSLRGASTKPWADFLSYAASISNLQSVVHAVVKFGTGSNPNAAYALLGNNGASGSNVGFCSWFEDRAAVPQNNAFRYLITKGGAAPNQVLSNSQDDVITPNQFAVIRIETKWVSTLYLRQRVFINGQLFGTAITSTTSTPTTTPTFELEIGAAGNGVLFSVMTLKELLIQSSVDTQETYDTFTTALINKHNITVPEVLSTVDVSQALTIYDTLNEVGRYYLSATIAQNPTKPWVVVGLFADGEEHTIEATKLVSCRKSVDHGFTFATKTTVYSPAGDLAVQDLGGGYSDNGRLHLFADVLTAGSLPFQPQFATYLYSDNDGDTWTTVDITSLLPSDGLAAYRFYGNLIENGGVLMFPFYKQTENGTTTESANYLLRSTDGGANWTVITVRAKGATYINEPTIIALNSSTILYIARNESTLEWQQFISTDNGVNWTDQGNLSLGETFTVATPGRLAKFKIDSTDVIAFYYPERDDTPVLKVVYATAANLIASGISGWNLTSKTTILNTGRRPHYGSVLHYMNNFNAMLCSAYENNPVDLSDNDFIIALLPSTQYSTVKTALGL